MPVTTSDIEAKLATALAAVTDAQRMVAEQNVQHANEVLLLQERIRDLEAGQAPRVVITEARVTDTGDIVLTVTGGEAFEVVLSGKQGPVQTVAGYRSGASIRPPHQGWDYWIKARAGEGAWSDEVKVFVPKPKPAPIPAEPVEPLPPIDLEQPGPTYTRAPENARFATNADEADRLLSLNRNDGHPVVITSFKSPRAFRLQPGNRNVWFINVAFEGLPGGMTECPISAPNGVGNVYIHRCTFDRCGAGMFMYDFRGEIIGNRFRDGGQAIGILWNNHKSPATGITISHNVAERLKGHDFELRTEHPQRWGSLGPTVIGAKFNYNRSTGSPTLPVRSMIYSLATGHAQGCEAIGNYSEGGEWAFEVMNGWRFAGNVAVNCDAMFAINTLSKLVHIDVGNRAIGVRVPVMPYVSDKGAPTGMQPAWKIAEVARQ